MKIVLAVDAISYPLTGIGRYAFELAKGLRIHPDVAALRFFSMGQWVELPSGNEPPGENTLRSQARIALAQQRWAVDLYRLLSPPIYRWRLRGFGDHLYHSPNYFLPSFGGPAIATVHDLSTIQEPGWHPESRVALIDAELPKTLARASHLITDSATVREQVITHYGWAPEKISAVPLGVDTAFHPRDAQTNAPALARYGLESGAYCLCVATIEPRKNIKRLIDAHAALPSVLRRRFPLVLVGGSGWKSDDIHDRIDVGQRHGTVRYLRYVPELDLPIIYAGARLFAFPSFYEGFGLPLLEAMASGIPVVTSTCPTLTELADNSALQVDPRDTVALIAALRRGLEDEPWRAQAAENGRRRAQDFTWETCVARTLEVYGQVANG